jgi:hypothetical protein
MVYPSITFGMMADKKVANELPAQKEAQMTRKKKQNPLMPPARPTAQNVVTANASDKIPRKGMYIKALAST